MSLREHDAPGDAHLTRRQVREAQAARSAKAVRRRAPSRGELAAIARPRQARPSRPMRTASSPSAPKRLLSLGALLGVGLLVVGMSVPANAFLTDQSGFIPTAATTKAPVQSLEVSADALSAAPTRDEFDAITYAEQLRLQYGNVSQAYTATTGAIRWPFPYTVNITDGFGPRDPSVSGSAFHNGIDFTPGGGTPIYAIADGVVTTHLEDQGGFGNHVIIQHDIPGQNVETLYAHMVYGSSPLQAGDTIKVGDFIGLVGNTGTSYGAHLHFEVHIDKIPVDPFVWLSNNAVN